MRGACAAALLLLLVAVPGISSAAESETGARDRAKLGEFVPSSEPFPAPAISFSETAGNIVDLADFRGKLVLLNL
jgi:hypothetical protein